MSHPLAYSGTRVVCVCARQAEEATPWQALNSRLRATGRGRDSSAFAFECNRQRRDSLGRSLVCVCMRGADERTR